MKYTDRDSMTLEEIARRARVSTATVSRALNNDASVTSSTPARVLKVREALSAAQICHFGGASGIAEMLLQCDEDEIRLLAALPSD